MGGGDESGDHDDNAEGASDTGEHGDEGVEELDQDALNEALRQAEEDRLKDPALAEDAQAFQDSKDDACSALDPYMGQPSTDPR